MKNRTILPSVNTTRGTSEWVCGRKDVPPRRMDSNTPKGYNPYGMVQVSEFSGWQQVVGLGIAALSIGGGDVRRDRRANRTAARDRKRGRAPFSRRCASCRMKSATLESNRAWARTNRPRRAKSCAAGLATARTRPCSSEHCSAGGLENGAGAREHRPAEGRRPTDCPPRACSTT